METARERGPKNAAEECRRATLLPAAASRQPADGRQRGARQEARPVCASRASTAPTSAFRRARTAAFEPTSASDAAMIR